MSMQSMHWNHAVSVLCACENPAVSMLCVRGDALSMQSVPGDAVSMKSVPGDSVSMQSVPGDSMSMQSVCLMISVLVRGPMGVFATVERVLSQKVQSVQLGVF